MPVNRDHAFADGPAFGRPKRRLVRGNGSDPEARAAEAWKRFDAHARIAGGCLLGPNAWCVNSLGDPDRIALGAGVICRGILRVEKFGAGRIAIGANAYVGDDCLLSSSAGIEIGEHALIAHGVQIFDNDSHPLDPAARVGDYASVLAHGPRGAIASAPVRIGARSWIGFNAIILKGVTIGENSVVAAGSVVSRDIPANTVAAGNPAAAVKEIT
ncbi:MAG TPA: DapH/DapD/GlmU-related protein [Chthoniobacteraceae bacterium]|nr:DapH/DapD/GlmU-related protein [Chthoniobacteraceae bacterium]